MIDRFRIIPTSHLVLLEGDKVFLMQRQNTGYRDGWFGIPAGHVEQGETFTQAMIREAQEEINIKLKAEDLSLICTVFRTQPGNERIDLFFSAAKWENSPINNESGKCSQIGWFDKNNLPWNTIPYIRETLRAIGCNQKFCEFNQEEFYS
jgi:ADP-ribose pyrophosphatase YjhB (NUDIX family)